MICIHCWKVLYSLFSLCAAQGHGTHPEQWGGRRWEGLERFIVPSSLQIFRIWAQLSAISPASVSCWFQFSSMWTNKPSGSFQPARRDGGYWPSLFSFNTRRNSNETGTERPGGVKEVTRVMHYVISTAQYPKMLHAKEFRFSSVGPFPQR